MLYRTGRPPKWSGLGLQPGVTHDGDLPLRQREKARPEAHGCATHARFHFQAHRMRAQLALALLRVPAPAVARAFAQLLLLLPGITSIINASTMTCLGGGVIMNCGPARNNQMRSLRLHCANNSACTPQESH